MSPRLLAFLFALALPVAAHAQDAPEPASSDTDAPAVEALSMDPSAQAPAPAPEPITYDKRVKAKKLAKLFRGQWRIQLPAPLQRQIDLMRLVLSGAGKAEVDAMQPTPEERKMLALMKLSIDAGGDEAEAQRAEQLAQLEAVRDGMAMTVTADRVTLSLPDESEDAAWEVVSTEDNQLAIRMVPDSDEPSATLTVHFVDEDHLILTSDKRPDRLVLHRVEG